MNSTAQTSQEWTPESAKQWMESKVWSNGWTVAPHESVNAVEFASQYEKNKEVWDAAFSFLAQHDLENMEPGKYVIIEGRTWVNVSDYMAKPAEDVKVEGHHRFIDLQYTIHGNELMGVTHEVDSVRDAYDPQKEIGFFWASNVKFYPTDASYYFLFFPSDYHQPSVKGEGEPAESRKIVVKIEYVQ